MSESKSLEVVSIGVNAPGAITMNSLELVEYINNERKEKALAAAAGFPSKGHAELRHDHFMAKVPEVLGKAATKFLGTASYTNGTGAKVGRMIYIFPKREACLMAMSYSYDIQQKVFDRITTLEEELARKPAFVLPDFTNPIIAARAWADEVEKVQILQIKAQELVVKTKELVVKSIEYKEKITYQQKQIEVTKPKADALDRFAAFAEGSMCITDAAKHLQLQPKVLFAHMQQEDWIYRRAGCSAWLGYQDRVKSGYLEHKITTVGQSDGSERYFPQVRVPEFDSSHA
jgi:phage antirepressor YoqD-like protein